MTRVIRFHEHGGPEVLRIEHVQVPQPAHGEVRIRVKALGINRAEALIRAGRYIESPTFPSGLGLEAAGIIEQLGEGVDGLQVGDRVSVIPPRSMVRWPAYGEQVVFPAGSIIKHPSSLSWEEAAASWMQYLTAYGALVDVAKLGQGDFLVVTAASSSVGLAAIQMANLLGATPIAVTRTSAKRAPLLAAGARHVIVTQEENLAERVREIAGPEGVRVVLDPIGGPLFEPLTAAMARGGILIEYGGLSPQPTPFPLATVLGKSLTLRGYLVHEVTTDPERLRAAKTFIVAGMETGALRPLIARRFPFEQIIEAHRFLESNEQFGKVVVMLQ